VSGELDRVRAEVAADRGHPAGAVSFLDASILERIEAQADALVKLATSRAQRRQEPAGDWLAKARAEKAERQRMLLASFTQTAPQPRDEAGRFVSTGFDGGARQPIPPVGDPVREHAEVVSRLAYQSKLGRSDF
jgi:hypothetical protein